MQIIRGKAPLRISFGGGGTDLEPYSSEQGGVTISTTVDKYAFGTLIPRSDHKIIIESLDYNQLVKYYINEILPLDGTLDLLKAGVNRLAPGKGFTLLIECDAPPGTGMGSSGAIAVLVIGLLLEYLERHLNPYQIAEMAYEIEKHDLNFLVGRQDQYASAFGGFNFIEYTKSKTLVTPIRLRRELINELESHLILCYMHEKRTKEDPVNIEIKQFEKKDKEVIRYFSELKDLTHKMKDNLLLGEIDTFLSIFKKAGENKLKRSILGKSKTVSNFISCAFDNNARALKTLGSAGGGYLLIFSDYFRRKSLIESLEDVGGTILPLHFEENGLQTWRTEVDSKMIEY